MKIRPGFVSNSSSSSFICLSVYTYKDLQSAESTLIDIAEQESHENASLTFDIDDLISKLLEAKAAGNKIVEINVSADAECDY